MNELCLVCYSMDWIESNQLGTKIERALLSRKLRSTTPLDNGKMDDKESCISRESMVPWRELEQEEVSEERVRGKSQINSGNDLGIKKGKGIDSKSIVGYGGTV